MHGNIWEWTNDWYGEYNLNDKINPQGLETGTHKVDRGGGFMILHGDAGHPIVRVGTLQEIEVQVLVLVW